MSLQTRKINTKVRYLMILDEIREVSSWSGPGSNVIAIFKGYRKYAVCTVAYTNHDVSKECPYKTLKPNACVCIESTLVFCSLLPVSW